MSLRFFYEGGLLFTALGTLSLFFIGILAQTGKSIHAANSRALETGFRNEALSLYLSEEKAKVEERTAELITAGDDKAVIAHVLDQISDPALFLRKVESLYDNPSAISRDTLIFCDGRVFALYSHSQTIADDVVGRVWSFLDITEQRRAEERVFQLSQNIRMNWNGQSVSVVSSIKNYH
jgi:hypothetical protein